MRPDFDEIRTLTKRFVLIPQKVAKFVFGVFRYECSGRGIGITEIGITEIGATRRETRRDEMKNEFCHFSQN